MGFLHDKGCFFRFKYSKQAALSYSSRNKRSLALRNVSASKNSLKYQFLILPFWATCSVSSSFFTDLHYQSELKCSFLDLLGAYECLMGQKIVLGNLPISGVE